MGGYQMKIAISGASGFIGTNLSHYFESRGHSIFPINRATLSDENKEMLHSILSQADIVINLAGASINKRWTNKYKKELRDSRIITTRKIVETINLSKHKPLLLLSASAVGYYHSEGHHNESVFEKGTGFLSDLCEEWETEAQNLSSDVRLCITRFGIVLADKGGAFGKMALPTKFGLIPILGSGRQYFPWIDLADLTRAIEYIIYNEEIKHIVNLVAPETISQNSLIRYVAKHYRGVIPLKIPAPVLSCIMGESASFLTEGQYVSSKKLQESDFVFKSPTISDFCSNLLD